MYYEYKHIYIDLLVRIGNVTATVVVLFLNQLALFEENVFKEMLQQMVSAEPYGGLVDIDFSKVFHFFKLFSRANSNIYFHKLKTRSLAVVTWPG